MMNELDVLKLFYDEMKARGVTRDVVSLSIDRTILGMLTQKMGAPVQLEEVLRMTDICIANEWISRTTLDPGYNYLSLTEAGLQIILASEYT